MSPATFLLSATVSLAAPAGQAPQPQPALVLSLEKDSFLPGEPFVIHLTVTNTSDTPVMIPAALDARYGMVEYWIQRPDENQERRFRPWFLFEDPRRRMLLPGSHLSEPSRIFFGADGWTFPTPGVYRVRLTLAGRSSEAIEVRVDVPSEGTLRNQSDSLVASSEAGLFLLVDGGDHLTEGVALLRDIAATDTILAGYASYAFGVSRSVPFSNLRTGAVREADGPEARRLIDRARQLMPPDAWHFRARGVQRLDAVLRLQGRSDLADQLQQDFRLQLQQANIPSSIRIQMERTAIIRR